MTVSQVAPRTEATSIMQPVLQRLGAVAPLTEAETRLVEGLGPRREQHGPGAVLIGEGEMLVRPRLILSGWVCRQRLLRDGRRQIFSLAVPGDVIKPGLITGAPAVTTVVALTRAVSVEASQFIQLATESGGWPNLAKALAAAATFDEGLLLDHMVRLGRLSAFERVAHFLLEVHARLAAAGIGDGWRFPLPLTQDVLADILGLSIVHVNRTLQQLRREQLIEIAGAHVTLLEPDHLAELADYRRSPQGDCDRPARAVQSAVV